MASLLWLVLMIWSLAACAQNVITTIAGTPWFFRGSGGPAASAPLGSVKAVAVDAAGNVFAGDVDNHTVVRISPNGILTVVAGNGMSGYSGDGEPATSASLGSPSGVAVDALGNLYIADWGRIRKVTPGGFISAVAGGGYAGDGGLATAAGLGTPWGVAVGPDGSLYVSEYSSHRVRKVSPSGIITTVAGTGVCGMSGDSGPATAATLCFPEGLAVDSQSNLYIADYNNNRIRKVNSWGTITTVAGGGSAGDGGPATAASLPNPAGVAVDTSGNLYIAQYSGSSIRKVGADGKITTVAGSFTEGFSGDGGAATAAAFRFPEGVAVGTSGDLYIADTGNLRVRHVAANGTVSTLAGNGLFKYSGDGGPATSASLNQPGHVALGSDGSLYIADSGNNRIRKVSPSGTVVTIAGTGTRGFSGDGGPAAGATLNNPFGVAVDGAGNVYFSDLLRVRKVGLDGSISTVAGDGVWRFSGDGGPGIKASLERPWGLAFDPAGNLFIADSANNRVRKLTPAGTINTFAGNGVSASSGDGG